MWRITSSKHDLPRKCGKRLVCPSHSFELCWAPSSNWRLKRVETRGLSFILFKTFANISFYESALSHSEGIVAGAGWFHTGWWKYRLRLPSNISPEWHFYIITDDRTRPNGCIVGNTKWQSTGSKQGSTKQHRRNTGRDKTRAGHERWSLPTALVLVSLSVPCHEYIVGCGIYVSHCHL